MSDPTLSGELADDLRRYFAATTATPLPRRVAEVSARTLSQRRRSAVPWLASTAGVLAAAALVLLLGTHLPHAGSGAALSSSAAGPAQLGSRAGISPQSAAVSYPGVTAVVLAQHGVSLVAPAGHGTATLSAAQAQQLAVARVGRTAGTPGSAVLAFATVSDQSTHATCLCWLVSVPAGIGKQGSGQT